MCIGLLCYLFYVCALYALFESNETDGTGFYLENFGKRFLVLALGCMHSLLPVML